MLLAVDIGNTQTSFGIYQNSKLTHHWKVATKVSRTQDEYLSLLYPLMLLQHIKWQAFKAVVVCSVVPQADRAFEQFCKIYWQLKPLRIDHSLKLGFGFNVDTPSEVGADRLANAAYAVQNLKLPAIVVDLGTATTFDVISVERNYEGGAILPGVRIALEALSSRTSKLPLVELGFPKSVIGKNTVQCIQAGILYGYCDLIDGLLLRTQTELGGSQFSVVLTGGYSSLLMPHLQTSSLHLPHLTLDGIEILYNLNYSNK